MNIEELIYSELIELRKEVTEIRKDLTGFKFKVIIYAIAAGTLGGGSISKVLSILA